MRIRVREGVGKYGKKDRPDGGRQEPFDFGGKKNCARMELNFPIKIQPKEGWFRSCYDGKEETREGKSLMTGLPWRRDRGKRGRKGSEPRVGQPFALAGPTRWRTERKRSF